MARETTFSKYDEHRYLSKQEYIATATNAAGGAFRNSFVANFGSLITSTFLGLTDENFVLVNTITFILSFWDIINDVLVADLIDRRTTRWGKFKPYVYLSALPLMFASILQWLPLGVFSNEPSQTAKVVFVVAIYFCNDLFGTFFNAASGGLNARITPSNVERGRMQAINSIIASPMGMSATVVMLVLRAVFTDVPEATLYFIGATILNVIGMPMCLYLTKVTKERIVVDEERPPKLREVYKDVLSNRPMMAIMISELVALGFNFSAYAYTYICRDVLSGIEFNIFKWTYTTNTESIMLFVSCLCIPPTFISIIGAPIIRRYVNDRTLMIFTRALSSLCYFAMFILCLPMWDLTKKQLFIRIVTVYSLHGFTTGFYNIMPNLMMLDSLDYGEWRTGRRVEATVYALKNLFNRIGGSVVTYLGSILLVTYIDYPTEDASKGVPQSAQQSLIYMFTVLPFIFSALSCIPLLYYNYIGNYKKSIAKELHEMRARAEGKTVDEFGEIVETEEESEVANALIEKEAQDDKEE